MIGSSTFTLTQSQPTFRVQGSSFGIRNILMASVTNNGPSIIYIYQGGPNGAAVGTLSVGVTQLFYVSPAQELTFQVDSTGLLINGDASKTTAPLAEVYAVFGDEIITGNNGRNGTMYAVTLPNLTYTFKARQLGFDLIRGIGVNTSTAGGFQYTVLDSNGNSYNIDVPLDTNSRFVSFSMSAAAVTVPSFQGVTTVMSDTAIIAGAV